jgi:phosphoglycerate dehydrogenase-like enzyme
MRNAIFLGQSQYLPLAYPEALRSEVGRRLCLLDVPAWDGEWKNRLGALAETDIILSTWGMPPLDAAFLEAAPRLRAVFYAGGSVKCFATPDAYRRGIQIASAWEANAVPVAEYALATVLLGLKGFWSSARLRQAGKFSHATAKVAGAYRSNVGLVSLGAIGKRVAAHLSHHEVNILAYDPFVNPAVAVELGVTLVSLEELFAKSEVVSIHAPWLPETEKMIHGQLLRAMRPGATLINTSRGAVVNEEDLCQVLQDRPDLTAVLDVTYPEPPAADSPLRTLENAVLTPHIAGSMGGEIARMGRWMVDEMNRYMDNQSLQHHVPQEMLSRMA